MASAHLKGNADKLKGGQLEAGQVIKLVVEFPPPFPFCDIQIPD